MLDLSLNLRKQNILFQSEKEGKANKNPIFLFVKLR